MRIPYFLISAMLVFVLAAAGCGSKIPPEVTDRVSWQGGFKTLQADPEAYAGEFVILGGEIVGIENLADYSEITVVQYPLDRENRPQPEKASAGRFLIRSDSFLDPEIYEPGKLVTAAGEITGAQKRAIGDYLYEHPVIKGDLWVWEPRESSFPRFHFGLGVGKTF